MGRVWLLERVFFALAGSITLLRTAVVSPWCFLLAAFVGVNQSLYFTAGACPASLALERIGIERRCPR